MPSSAESDVTVSVPATLAPLAGAVTEPVGGLESIGDGGARPAGSRPGVEERGHSPYERPVTGHVGAFEGSDAYRRSRAADVRSRSSPTSRGARRGSRRLRPRARSLRSSSRWRRRRRHRDRRACLARPGSRRPRRRCRAAAGPPPERDERDRTDAERNACEQDDAPGRTAHVVVTSASRRRGAGDARIRVPRSRSTGSPCSRW